MNKFYAIALLCILSYAKSFSQTDNKYDKDFRISAGYGISNSAHGFGKIGPATWIQFEDRLSNKFSIAMESEFLHFRQPGYYPDSLLEGFGPNVINLTDNDFSLLVKYYFLSTKKLKVAVASGWTYCVQQEQYFLVVGSSTTFIKTINTTSHTDYRIPLMAEIALPVLKNIDFLVKGKYYLNNIYGDTFSTSFGLSLKL